MVEAFCYEFFVWCWCCEWCDIVWVGWVFDVVVPGVWKVVSGEDVCVIGVIDQVETAVVEVVPPMFSVYVEKFNGCFVSACILVKIPGVNTLAS